MKTIWSESAIVLDAQGYIQAQGVRVTTDGETVTIGITVHDRETITAWPDRLESAQGWVVLMDLGRNN